MRTQLLCARLGAIVRTEPWQALLFMATSTFMNKLQLNLKIFKLFQNF